MDPVRILPQSCLWVWMALVCFRAVTAQGSDGGNLSEENLIIIASVCTVFIVLLITVVVTVILVCLFCAPCQRRGPGTWVGKAPGANELCHAPLIPFPSQLSLNSELGQRRSSDSHRLKSNSSSVVMLNDMYRSSDSFVNKRDTLCSSLSELNRRASSSGLIERHYGGDSLSQDPNGYRILEVEMGMFSPSNPKAKSVACLRGLAEEEEGGRGVASSPPHIPNWVLLHPSSAELTEGSSRQSNRKQKARSMDELPPQKTKRVVRFEDESDIPPSDTRSSTHCEPGVGLRTSAHCNDTRFVSVPDPELSDSHFHSQMPLMRRRSLDDIINLETCSEKPRGTPRSHSYATLDVIPEDRTLLEDDIHHLDDSMGSRELQSLNSTNAETNVTMDTIVMATSNSMFEDEAPHCATSATDSCSSLSQPGLPSAGENDIEIDGVMKAPSSEEKLNSNLHNGTQTSTHKETVVEHPEVYNTADDTYQDMLAVVEEESDDSSVSQTSMERTPPLRIKVSFTIIEEAERKVVKDQPTSPLRVGGEHNAVARSPQRADGTSTSHYTTSHISGSPDCKVSGNLPPNTSLLEGEDSDHHGNQSADCAGEATSTSVHIIKEIFLKQSQTEVKHAKKLKPPDKSQQRRKSREILSKRWPQLLEEEERRRVDGDDDLLLCASVTTLDLADSETDLQSTSETNLLTGGRVKVYSGSEEFTDGQPSPWPPAVAVDADTKEELEEVDWFSGVVTETLQFQMVKQDEAPETGGSHFQLGNLANDDDSTSDSTSDESDDDAFVRPSIVSGLALTSSTPPPRYPTLQSILNHDQMYLPTSGESPSSTGDSPTVMPVEHRKVSTKPRMSIIREEEETIDELIRRF